jgi:hypothetical protein
MACKMRCDAMRCDLEYVIASRALPSAALESINASCSHPAVVVVAAKQKSRDSHVKGDRMAMEIDGLSQSVLAYTIPIARRDGGTLNSSLRALRGGAYK